jgi:hypothetical protein
MTMAKTKTKKSKIKINDTVEFWLNDYPERFEKPTQSPLCACNFTHFFTKRLTRLSVLSGLHFCGIDFDSYQKLCNKCRDQIYDWYYKVAFADIPSNTTKEIFEAMIAENNIMSLLENARSRYELLLRGYRYKHDKTITKGDIEDQKTYFENCQDLYKKAANNLKEAIDEKQARDMGYQV